jgi:signal transduction histidine kinase
LNSGDAQSGGLGLAIAQAIAIAQGGTIECASTVGVGSTFTVILRITYPQEAVPEITPKQKLILR